jgi:hypothetical protein
MLKEPNDSVIAKHVTTFKCHIMFIFLLLLGFVMIQLLSLGQPWYWDCGEVACTR